jgi:uncharacterized delta-60 repeat protein
LRRVGAVLAVWVVSLVCTGSAVAAPGDLDRSFGDNGVLVISPSVSTGVAYSSVSRMATGPRDEIYVLSIASAGRCVQSYFCAGFRIDKWGRDGELDRGFGIRAGRVLEIPGRDSFDIATDRRGRVILAASGEAETAIVRLMPDGMLDTSFGNGGRVTLDRSLAISELAIGSGDRIVFVGRTRTLGPPFSSNLLVGRLLADGRLDGGFGDSGIAVVDFLHHDLAGGVALRGDEAIVTVKAESECCATNEVLLRLARFGPDGRLIAVQRPWPSQRRNGERWTPADWPIAARGSRIRVFGWTPDGTLATGFLSNGRRDARFGVHGFSLLRHLSLAAQDGVTGTAQDGVSEDSAGRLLVAGTVAGVDPVGNTRSEVAVSRLTARGKVDRTFHWGAPVTVRGGARNRKPGKVLGTAVQADGKIVLLASWVPECVRECKGIAHYALIRLLGGTSKARCRGIRATVVGTRRSERIVATAKRDVIAALGGNDVVRGRQGDDLICGGRGRDELLGGKGSDRLFGGPGADRRRP